MQREARSEDFHKETMKKYTRGVNLPTQEELKVTLILVTNKYQTVKNKQLKKVLEDARSAALNAARAEMLLVEEPG